MCQRLASIPPHTIVSRLSRESARGTSTFRMLGAARRFAGAEIVRRARRRLASRAGVAADPTAEQRPQEVLPGEEMASGAPLILRQFRSVSLSFACAWSKSAWEMRGAIVASSTQVSGAASSQVVPGRPIPGAR